MSLFVLLSAAPSASAQWPPLLNGKDLSGWESIGDGVWNVLKDGRLVGPRDIRKKSANQAWLYTKKDFDEFAVQRKHAGKLDTGVFDVARSDAPLHRVFANDHVDVHARHRPPQPVRQTKEGNHCPLQRDIAGLV